MYPMNYTFFFLNLQFFGENLLVFILCSVFNLRNQNTHLIGNLTNSGITTA